MIISNHPLSIQQARWLSCRGPYPSETQAAADIYGVANFNHSCEAIVRQNLTQDYDGGWGVYAQRYATGGTKPCANTSKTCFVGWYRHTPALSLVRSLSGVFGLPAFECVKTPWQP